MQIAATLVDLTTSEGKDTPGRIAFLCRKAMQPADPRHGIPPSTAVCVYPNLVRVVKKILGDSGRKRPSVMIGSLPNSSASAPYVVTDVLIQIVKVVDGNNQGPDYFSLP